MKMWCIAIAVQLFVLISRDVKCQTPLDPIISPNPEIERMKSMTTPEFVTFYGYGLETHVVETKDGYLLTTYRVISPKFASEANRYPIIIQHAMLDSSDSYCVNGPGKSLAFILADAGYDVWMPNSRGNKHSRAHKTLNPDISPGPYWTFSWWELGIYDLPACIDYILMTTDQEKLSYFGHSQGGTTLMVLLSEFPEYNDKIDFAGLMAPLGYLNNLDVPLKSIFLTISALEPIKNQEFVRNSKAQSVLATAVCGPVGGTVCNYGIGFLDGPSENQRDEEMLPVYFSIFPAGCGSNQLLHYGREVLRGYYGKFLKSLLDPTPKDLSFEKISALIKVYWSKTDTHNPKADIDHLLMQLPNHESYEIEEDFNHVDYMWGILANEVLYSKMIADVERVRSSN